MTLFRLTVNETTLNIALVHCNGFISEASSFSLQLRFTEACSRVRYDSQSLFKHKKLHSPGNVAVDCKTFSREDVLTRHLKLGRCKGPNPKEYNCEKYPKSFSRKEHLQRHTHSEKIPIRLRFC